MGINSIHPSHRPSGITAPAACALYTTPSSPKIWFANSASTSAIVIPLASSFTTRSIWFAVRGRLRLDGPLANHDTQLVGLILQSAHPLHLHRHVTTDFRDLAFNGV